MIANDSSLFGLGLRPHHYPSLRQLNELPILEVMADNYLFHKGGPGLAHLQALGERCRFVLHGVGLNIGSSMDLNWDYVQALKSLKDRCNPLVVSDHFCFSAGANGHSYELLPLARGPELMQRLLERLDRIQNVLGCRFSLENVSSYVEHKDNDRSELEFLEELAKRSGCGLLLDINNVYVSAFNHGFDAWQEILKITPEHVTQFHIAGHSEETGFYLDTHDQKVKDPVWLLLQKAWQRIGARPLILERDDDLPFDELWSERANGLIHLNSGFTDEA